MPLITYKPPTGYRLPDGASRSYMLSVRRERLIGRALMTAGFVAAILAASVVLLYAFPALARIMGLGEIIGCALLGCALSECHFVWRRWNVVTLPEDACVKVKGADVPAPAPEAAPERVSLLSTKMMPIHPSVGHDRDVFGLSVRDRLRAYADGLETVRAEMAPPPSRIDPRLATLQRGATLH